MSDPETRSGEGDSEAAAIAAAGGMRIVPPEADPVAIHEAVEGGVRALEMHRGETSMLAGTALEFLHVVSVTADASGLRDLPHLRSLSVDAWRGDLDLREIPTLEWLHVAELQPGQLPSLAVSHASLRHVRIGQYRGEDVSPLASLAKLEYLALWQTPALLSLRGIPETVEVLELARCPRLATLEGIEQAAGLQAVVLERCSLVDDISPLTALADLRLVQLDMEKLPSLVPLADHPALEFLWLLGGTTPPGEVEKLLDNPRLRMVNARRATWVRTTEGWAYAPDVYALSAERLEARHQLIEEFNARKSR